MRFCGKTDHEVLALISPSENSYGVTIRCVHGLVLPIAQQARTVGRLLLIDENDEPRAHARELWTGIPQRSIPVDWD